MSASRVKELADEEAARAEAETPPDEPEGETPDVPEEPTEEVDPEAEMKALNAILRRFERALAKLWGLEPPLPPAMSRGVFGFVHPEAVAMREHDDFRTCETCNGHGVVITGSHRAGNETEDCPDERCRGRGYWRKNRVQPVGVVPVPGGAATAATNGPQDEFEHPAWMGDPTIGANP